MRDSDCAPITLILRTFEWGWKQRERFDDGRHEGNLCTFRRQLRSVRVQENASTQRQKYFEPVTNVYGVQASMNRQSFERTFP